MASSRVRNLSLACVLGLALGGCFQLDPFLYTPQRLTAYSFDPKGSSALTTIDPGQLEQVSIQTEDGLILGGVYVKSSVQPPRAYALFFHGKGSALPGHFRYLKRLSNLGYDVLGFDYRGFGTSTDVTPTEAGIEKDSRAALQWLKARSGDPARIFFYGESFGGATATQRAELDPPAALVLESTFGSIEEFKTDSTGMDLPAGYVAKDSWATSTRIKNVHAPVMLLHGLSDDFVRPEFSENVYANANEPKKLVLVEGGTHGHVPEAMGDAAYIQTINGFVGQFIPAP